MLGDGLPIAADGQIPRGQQHLASTDGRIVWRLIVGVDADDLVLGAAVSLRQPDAEFGEVESGITEHLVRGAVGDDDRAFESAAVDLLLIALLGDAGGLLFVSLQPEHHHAIDHVDPRSGAVLDQHHRGMIGVEHIAYRVHDLGDAVGVEVRRGFVEQQHARTHGQRAGQGESLHLPAGQVQGRTVQLNPFQSHRTQTVAHPLPDLVPRHVEVLGTERHVVAEPLEDRLRIGVLQHQADAAARAGDRHVVNQHAAFGHAALRVGGQHRAVGRHLGAFRVLLSPKQTRGAFEDCGFADAGRAEQQHTLPRLDGDVQPPYGEMPARGVTVPPVLEAQHRVVGMRCVMIRRRGIGSLSRGVDAQLFVHDSP